MPAGLIGVPRGAAASFLPPEAISCSLNLYILEIKNKKAQYQLKFNPILDKILYDVYTYKKKRGRDLQGNTLQEFKDHKSSITSVAFSPDGKIILTGSSDKTVRLLDLGEKIPLEEFLKKGNLGKLTLIKI